jgi:hypothetical protein
MPASEDSRTLLVESRSKRTLPIAGNPFSVCWISRSEQHATTRDTTTEIVIDPHRQRCTSLHHLRTSEAPRFTVDRRRRNSTVRQGMARCDAAQAHAQGAATLLAKANPFRLSSVGLPFERASLPVGLDEVFAECLSRNPSLRRLSKFLGEGAGGPSDMSSRARVTSRVERRRGTRADGRSRPSTPMPQRIAPLGWGNPRTPHSAPH